jgi:hypothetical protein
VAGHWPPTNSDGSTQRSRADRSLAPDAADTVNGLHIGSAPTTASQVVRMPGADTARGDPIEIVVRIVVSIEAPHV